MGTHAAKNRHSSTTSQRQEPSIIAGKKINGEQSDAESNNGGLEAESVRVYTTDQPGATVSNVGLSTP